VPPEVIVAIVGVETFYGRNTGKYKELDRARDARVPLPAARRFLSRRAQAAVPLAWAAVPVRAGRPVGLVRGRDGPRAVHAELDREVRVDGDGDGKIDLWASRADALASIGNYLKGYGWAANAPIADPAQVTVDAELVTGTTLEPRTSVGELARLGYVAPAAREQALAATLVTLDGEQGAEYWIAYQNFYVISRYNRSPLYCMAVMQLAQAIAAAANDKTAGPP
jgi:membrane-bound lytic murein transglycosylase B